MFQFYLSFSVKTTTVAINVDDLDINPLHSVCNAIMLLIYQAQEPFACSGSFAVGHFSSLDPSMDLERSPPNLDYGAQFCFRVQTGNSVSTVSLSHVVQQN